MDLWAQVELQTWFPNTGLNDILHNMESQIAQALCLEHLSRGFSRIVTPVH